MPPLEAAVWVLRLLLQPASRVVAVAAASSIAISFCFFIVFSSFYFDAIFSMVVRLLNQSFKMYTR